MLQNTPQMLKRPLQVITGRYVSAQCPFKVFRGIFMPKRFLSGTQGAFDPVHAPLVNPQNYVKMTLPSGNLSRFPNISAGFERTEATDVTDTNLIKSPLIPRFSPTPCLDQSLLYLLESISFAVRIWPTFFAEN